MGTVSDSDDAGKLIALLDTRNAFEVDQGTFDGAIDWPRRSIEPGAMGRR